MSENKARPLSAEELPGLGDVVWAFGLGLSPEIAWLFRDAGEPPCWETPHLGVFDLEYVTSWRPVTRLAELDAPAATPERQGGRHLSQDGKFLSDKYPWCPAGFIALKFSDPRAAAALRAYAVDCSEPNLARDILEALEAPAVTPEKRKEAELS